MLINFKSAASALATARNAERKARERNNDGKKFWQEICHIRDSENKVREGFVEYADFARLLPILENRLMYATAIVQDLQTRSRVIETECDHAMGFVKKLRGELESARSDVIRKTNAILKQMSEHCYLQQFVIRNVGKVTEGDEEDHPEQAEDKVDDKLEEPKIHSISRKSSNN